MDKKEQAKKDLMLMLWLDLFLFGSMIAIYFIDKKYNTLTYLAGKIL